MLSVLFDDVNISCCNLATIECHMLTSQTHILLLGLFPLPGYMFCQQLSSCSTDVEKLVVTQLVRFLAFHQTQKLITVFVSAGQWSILSQMAPMPSCPISATVCLQHRILGFVNRTTVRQLPALPHHFGISDHHGVFSYEPKSWNSLGTKSGLYSIFETPIHIAAAKSWKQFIFMVVTGAKRMWMCKKLLHSGAARKAQNSVLKAYVP